MDIYELSNFLNGRSSVRIYSEKEVPEKVILQIIDVTKSAPTAGNLEAWDVIVVTDEALRENLYDAAYSQEHVRDAPLVLVVCANYVRSMSRYGERGILYAIQDAAIAATYMMIAAHSLGLGTCWTGAFDDEEIREVLATPTHIRPLALLTIGYRNETVISPERMDTKDHIHKNGW